MDPTVANSFFVSASTPGTPAGDATPAPAYAADVDRFHSLMTVDPAAATTAAAPVDVVAPPGRGTLGDAILRGLNHLGQISEEGSARILEIAQTPIQEMSTAQLVALQTNVLTHSVNMDFAAKVASMLVSDINQLTKLQ